MANKTLDLWTYKFMYLLNMILIYIGRLVSGAVETVVSHLIQNGRCVHRLYECSKQNESHFTATSAASSQVSHWCYNNIIISGLPRHDCCYASTSGDGVVIISVWPSFSPLFLKHCTHPWAIYIYIHPSLKQLMLLASTQVTCLRQGNYGLQHRPHASKNEYSLVN